ncbi:MAG: hypothetical protein DCF12_16725, partial [Snowella sp.]
MLYDLFKKNCCLPIGVLVSFLIPFRSVASDLSPPVVSFEGSVQNPYSLVTTNPFLTSSKVDSQDFLPNPKDRIKKVERIGDIMGKIRKRCNCEKDFQVDGNYSLSGSGFGNKSLAQAESVSPEELDKSIEDLLKRLQVLGDNIPEFIWLSSPGISSNVPTAFGASLGDVGIGVGFQNRTRFTQTADGGGGIAFGLGDPYNAVGFDVGIGLNDLGINGNGSFGSRGSFLFKLHRVLPEDFRIAVAVDNALVWGGSDADTSVYGVVSKTFRLKESRFESFSRLYLNVGVGSGIFRTEDQVNNTAISDQTHHEKAISKAQSRDHNVGTN